MLALRQALVRAADRVVPAELALYFQVIGFGRTRVLGTMVELGIADALGEEALTADELAGRLGLHADSLHRFLRAAATADVVRLDRDGRFSLVRVGRALRADHPAGLHHFVRYLNLRSTQAAWEPGAVAETLRTGQATFPLVHGRSIWAHYAEHPEEEQTFAASMRRVTELDLPAIVHGYPWPQQGTVCDVAGGVGTVLAGVLAARPALRGILVEAPGVLEEAEAHLAEKGVRARVDLVADDMFERIKADADVYVLKDVLHDWDDERCARILATVRAAMRPGARVVLIEGLLERNEADPIVALTDVQMLTQTDGGRQRSVAELQALLRDARLEPGAVHRPAGPGLVEAVAR
ncbi:MAG TPA: methyltransferase [Thermoleophilaceae bacterium]|nr:methyltransferase [Thermoleophilaceae bacterium]